MDGGSAGIGMGRRYLRNLVVKFGQEKELKLSMRVMIE